MLVSTAAALISIMHRDKKAIRLAVHKGIGNKDDDKSSFSWMGSMLAMSFAGPLIYKFIEHAFGAKLFGDPDSTDLAEQQGLVGAAVEAVKTGSSNMLDSLLGKPKKAEESAPAPDQVEQGPTTRGLVRKGSQISKIASPTKDIDNALRAVAIREKIEYGLLYAFAGVESTFSSGAQASSSSAQGLFQFTSSTWDYLTNKIYPELGYVSADRKDPAKSATVASKYIKSIQTTLKNFLGKMPTIGQTYLGYFMGPSGAKKFLGALLKDANQLGSSIFPNQAKANPNIFSEGGKPLTLKQILDKLEGKVGVYYAQAGTVSGQGNTQMATNSPGKGDSVTPVGQGAQVAQVSKPTAQPPRVEATATQVVQAVTPSQLPSSFKVERYTLLEGESQNYILPHIGSGGNNNAELTYVRDSQNRMTAVYA